MNPGYSLYAATVVCYARPFTHNEPYGPLPEKWHHFEDNTHQKVHDALLKDRHELIAHSDLTRRKASVIPPGYSMGEWEGQRVSSEEVSVSVNIIGYKIDFFKEVLLTARNLNDHLTEEIHRLTEVLYGGMELPRAPFRLKIDEGL